MPDVAAPRTASRRPHATESGVSWVTAGVGLTLAFYCVVVVVPYAAVGASVPPSGPWDGSVWVLALLAVQVAPLVALVAGPWALWTGVAALRRGREGVAAPAAACAVLCAVLAGLSVSPIGMSLLSALAD